MAASRSSSGVDLPCPSSRSSSPTVAASSGPIVVLISIRRLLPSVRSGLRFVPNICSITRARESSPLAGSVDGQGDRGQKRDHGTGAGEHPPAVLPRPPPPGGLRRPRRGGRDPGHAGRGQRLGGGRAARLGGRRPGRQEGGRAGRPGGGPAPPARPGRGG